MADLNKIVEDLSSLTVLEAAELSKLLEDKWGVSAAAPVAAVAAPATGGPSSGSRAAARVPRSRCKVDLRPLFGLTKVNAA